MKINSININIPKLSFKNDSYFTVFSSPYSSEQEQMDTLDIKIMPRSTQAANQEETEDTNNEST